MGEGLPGCCGQKSVYKLAAVVENRKFRPVFMRAGIFVFGQSELDQRAIRRASRVLPLFRARPLFLPNESQHYFDRSHQILAM